MGFNVRINDDSLWLEFKKLCIDENIRYAKKVEQLVRKEVATFKKENE